MPLHFDIEWQQLRQIGDDLQASETQIRLALSRTLSRLASRLATLSRKGLKDELQLRRLNALRKRLKSIRLRVKDGGIQLWYGLNDMPVSWFKGTPKETTGGATFRGVTFDGAFVARSRYSKQKTIMKRKGKARLHIEEQQLPIEDQAQVFIEDNVFDKLEPLFWPMFERELAARVKFKIGKA